MSETQELKAYIGRCIICNEVCAISVEDEDARREFERDGMRVELLPLAEAQELWKAYGKCICHKPEALRAELAQLRAERDTWRENWNTASKELADLHDQLAEAQTEIQRLRSIAQHMEACRSLLSVEDNEVLCQAISAKIGELAEARKDSERIDWLEPWFVHSDGVIVEPSEECEAWRIANSQGEVIGRGTNLRAAIDAAKGAGK